MQEVHDALQKLGIPEHIGSSQAAEYKQPESGGGFKLSSRQRAERNAMHFNRTTRLLESDDRKIKAMREARMQLPIQAEKDKVLALVQQHQVCIIVGSTGSGKTTQVVQMILDDAALKHEAAGCNILVAQPRRIACTSVAERVAEERGEVLQETVGYSVRFDVSTKISKRHGTLLPKNSLDCLHMVAV